MTEGDRQDPAAARLLTIGELVAAGRDLRAPFRLDLHLDIAIAGLHAVDGEAGSGSWAVAASSGRSEPVAARAPGAPVMVHCEQVLRLQPGRRLVARARVGKGVGTVRVLLKCFFGPAARRYASREAAGSRLLGAAGVAAPRLLGRARSADFSGHALLFEYLDDAHPLDGRDPAAMAAAAAALARLHNAGCRHADLHLGNVLFVGADRTEPRFVDADGIRRQALAGLRAGGLGARAGVCNLAWLCALRPSACDDELAMIHRAYAAGRGWTAAPAGGSLGALYAETRRARRQRVRRYLHKTERDCTEFAVRRDFSVLQFRVREFSCPALQRLVADPEAAMRAGVMLKDGNSATVVRAVAGERTWIVKRYNVKNVWHRARRSLRSRTRYRNAWRNGQCLHLLGIPTGRPVALVEHRLGPLPGVAYLIMEDAGDRDLQSAALEGGVDDSVINAIVELFRGLAAHGISHGDTKATNFLLCDDGVAVIDLDSMLARHRGHTRRHARDVERFLENWIGQPVLRERFTNAFRAAGLRRR